MPQPPTTQDEERNLIQYNKQQEKQQLYHHVGIAITGKLIDEYGARQATNILCHDRLIDKVIRNVDYNPIKESYQFNYWPTAHFTAIAGDKQHDERTPMASIVSQ